MSRKSARRKRSNPLSLTILAVVVICTLAFGTVAAIVADRNSGSNTSNSGSSDTNSDAAAKITPGAEVNRLETQVAQNPTDVDTMAVLAEVLANSGRVPESIQWYTQAVALRGDDEQLRLAFGQALERNGDTFDAELQFQKAETLAPTDPVPPYYLGQLYDTQSPPREAEALAAYQRAVDLDPNSIVASQAKQRLEELEASPTAASPSARP